MIACKKDYTITVSGGCALNAFTKQLADTVHFLPSWVKTTNRLWLSDATDTTDLIGVFDFTGAPVLERSIPSPDPNNMECDGIFQEPITGKVVLKLTDFGSNVEYAGFCASGASVSVTTQVAFPLTTNYNGSYFGQFISIPSAAHPTVCLFRRINNGFPATEPNVLLIRVDTEVFGNEQLVTASSVGDTGICYCPTTDQIAVPSGYSGNGSGDFMITCLDATTLAVATTFIYPNANNFKPQSAVYVSSTNKFWVVASIGFLQTTLAVINVTTGVIEDQFLIVGGDVGRQIAYDLKCDKIILSNGSSVQVYNVQTHALEHQINGSFFDYSFITIDEVTGDAYTANFSQIFQIGS